MADDVVRAKRFELVDDHGNVCASLQRDSDTDSAALTFMDRNTETQRVGVGVDVSGTGYVRLRGGDGQGGLKIDVDLSGAANIYFGEDDAEQLRITHTPWDPEDETSGAPTGILITDGHHGGVRLGMSPTGQPSLELVNALDIPVIELRADKNGIAELALTGPAPRSSGILLRGPTRHSGAEGQDYNVAMFIHDALLKPRIAITLYKDGVAAIAVMDQEGNLVWGSLEER